jgi:hypothetical protein
MAASRSELVAEDSKTPVAWPVDGGNIDAVREIIVASAWWFT